MNDESFHTVYDCSNFKVILWCKGDGGRLVQRIIFG